MQANVFYGGTGEIKLGDFGLAKFNRGSDGPDSPPGAAGEQLRLADWAALTSGARVWPGCQDVAKASRGCTCMPARVHSAATELRGPVRKAQRLGRGTSWTKLQARWAPRCTLPPRSNAAQTSTMSAWTFSAWVGSGFWVVANAHGA